MISFNLSAFFPNGADYNDVTGGNENGWDDKNGQGDKCHVKLPFPLLVKIDPTLRSVVFWVFLLNELHFQSFRQTI